MIGGFAIYTFGVPDLELNIIWQSWDSSGLEQLHLSQSQDGITAYSIIIGAQDNIPFSLQYTLHCTPQWHVREANLRVEAQAITTNSPCNLTRTANGLPLQVILS